jgi:hypothetical protein
MAVSERLFACVVAALLGGCSLITSASDHQDGVEADGGPDDAFTPDAGDGEDMRVTGDMDVREDLGSSDMTVPTDMSVDGCGVADLNGGSLVADGLEAYDVTDFTIEVWFQPDAATLSGSRNIFGRWLEYMESGSYALYLTDGRPALALSCNGDDFSPFAADPSLDAGNWTHLAATYNASTGRIQLFVDGTRLVDDNSTCGPHELGTTADLVLGYDDPSGGEPAEGLVDEARLSDVVRYTEAFTPERTFESDGDTVALYHFEDASLPAADSSTNENDMDAEGAAGLTTACRP